jgi:hypothetical protein
MRGLERLHVGIGGDELDAGHAGLNHAIDGISAAAAHADNFDASSTHTFFVVLNAHLHGFISQFFHLGYCLLIANLEQER